MVAWVNCHKLISIITACILVLTGCIAGMMIHDATSAPPFWLVYGGNTDKGDGNGGGMAREQLIAGGWTTPETSYQITWNADIAQGTAAQADAAMPPGKQAFNRFCGGQGGCIIAGFSLGTAPALQLAAETGTAPESTYLFGGPQPSTGIWHQPYADNPFIEPWLAGFGGFKTDRPVPPGTQVFYDTRDPYANSAPQCGGPGLFLLNLQGHYIISREQANGSHIWTGTDGATMHEVGYAPAPWGLPRSGSDPSQPWDFCPPKLPPAGIPAMNGDSGVPALPGIPTR